jgi:paraquat-inducible protein A
LKDSKLDSLIICPKCDTLQKRVEVRGKEVAKCFKCKNVLYRSSKSVFNKTFAYSITALILFIVANLFPIINVVIAAEKHSLTMIDMVFTLIKEDFLVVAVIIFIAIFLAPLSILLSYIIIGVLSRIKKGKRIVKYLMVFITQMQNWAMVDIFFVSILVALVKLFGYAEVEFGVSFFALILFVIVDIYAIKSIKPVELWTYYHRIYNER